MLRSLIVIVSLAAVASACDRRPSPEAATDQPSAIPREPIPSGIDSRMVEWRSDGILIPSMDSLRKTPGYVVDSVFPAGEALGRFQATVTAPRPTRFSGGAPTADALLRHYWAALVRGDTVTIRTLVVSHAEFAWLYFPESAPFASGMQPSAAWILYEGTTGRGLTSAFRAAIGRDTSVAATVCMPKERTEGRSRTFGPCGIVRRSSTATDTLWIGGTLVARDGVIKFLGLDNAL